jgi:prolyl-tRNA synthetase
MFRLVFLVPTGIGAAVGGYAGDAGLVVPPKLAATHVVLIPIAKSADDKTRVMEKLAPLATVLKGRGLSVLVDDDDSKSPGYKYNEHELTGVCLRIELGPKDLAAGQCVLARRDTRQKEAVPIESLLALPVEEVPGHDPTSARAALVARTISAYFRERERAKAEGRLTEQ